MIEKNFISDNYPNFISHFKTEDWGHSIYIIERTGNAIARMYWYSDDNTTVYLDMLSVEAEYRNKGIGTELQKIRESIGVSIGATTACLWVKKHSWMYEWYKRRGYSDLRDREDDDGTIWMMKTL